jgi:hypothetical protein
MNDQTAQASNYIKDHTHQFGQVFHKSEMVVAADSVISYPMSSRFSQFLPTYC